MAETQYSLLQLNTVIRETLRESFRETVWVAAEINEMNIAAAGHCYIELIEKDRKSDQIIARARATIWMNTWRMLRSYFETATGQEFQTGIHILVQASIEFHEIYGYSLNIKDIDPVYTLGDLERKRMETIRRLEQEGIFDMNRQLAEEPVPQRLAIISSPTAAGLQDFMHQINTNSYGYRFFVKLFPAIMQGKQAEGSILRSLDQINAVAHLFDAVLIIRGGGAQADLNCFNSYAVASHVAQFPVPVITGIGHERDMTITDLVAHTRMKTPTAAAEYLIGRLAGFESILDGFTEGISQRATGFILAAANRMMFFFSKIYPVARDKFSSEYGDLIRLRSDVSGYLRSFLLKKRYFLQDKSAPLTRETGFLFRKLRDLKMIHSERLKKLPGEWLAGQTRLLEMKLKDVQLTDPENILKKGFALVSINGKIIRKASALKPGEKMNTEFQDGKVSSIVREIDMNTLNLKNH